MGQAGTFIFYSSQTPLSPSENSNWWLIDEKNSPPGLDGSMKNIMPHLSKWANELARMITIPFFQFTESLTWASPEFQHIISPIFWQVPCETVPHYGLLQYPGTKCQVSLSFIPPGIKSFKWDSLFLHFEFEEHRIIFPKSWSALHTPQSEIYKECNKIIRVFLELKKKTTISRHI